MQTFKKISFWGSVDTLYWAARTRVPGSNVSLHRHHVAHGRPGVEAAAQRHGDTAAGAHSQGEPGATFTTHSLVSRDPDRLRPPPVNKMMIV